MAAEGEEPDFEAAVGVEIEVFGVVGEGDDGLFEGGWADGQVAWDLHERHPGEAENVRWVDAEQHLDVGY